MARKRRESSSSLDSALLPIMNIMLLMIPALLLAMEVARMGAIAVVPPRAVPGTEGEPPPTEMPLRVLVAEDGFVVAVGEAPGERIPLANPSAVPGQPEAYDFAALEARARRIKDAHPTGHLQLDAEGSIPLQTLVATMDTLRGSQCRLAEVRADEAPGPECLYTDVTVAPGTRIAGPQSL